MSRDDFLADLQLGTVPKEYDTANFQKVSVKSHTVPKVPIFYLGPAPKHPNVEKRPCYAIVGPSFGGPDASLGDSLPLTTGDPAKPTHRMHQYDWVGPDKRTLRLNGWRQGHGRGADAEFVQYDPDYPFLLRSGDFFTGGCKKEYTLPDREFMPAEQISFDACFWLKAKPLKKDGVLAPVAAGAPAADGTAEKASHTDHGHFTNGDMVVLTTCVYAGRPAEERLAYGMPYETQLIPRIFPYEDPAEERKQWAKSTHTPQALIEKALPNLNLNEMEFIERHVVRLPMNRVPRLGDEDPMRAGYILPDESYLFIPGTHCRSRIMVGVSKRNAKSQVAEVKGQTGSQRLMPVDSVTMNIIQLPDKESTPGVIQKFTLLNAAISGLMHLLASGISFAPLLVEILCHGPSGGVAFDILFHVLIKKSRDNGLNKVRPTRTSLTSPCGRRTRRRIAGRRSQMVSLMASSSRSYGVCASSSFTTGRVFPST
jgi:hypothetical protein